MQIGNLKKLRQGGATVEAAVIMPMVVVILVLLIYLFFYRYNCVVLTHAAYCSALRASRLEYASSAKQKEEAERSVKQLTGTSLLATGQYEVKIAVRGKQTNVTLQMAQRIPFSKLVMPLSKTDRLTFSCSKKALQSNPYQFIRSHKKGGKK